LFFKEQETRQSRTKVFLILLTPVLGFCMETQNLLDFCYPDVYEIFVNKKTVLILDNL